MLKPVSITYEEAAVVPQYALVALQGLRDKGQIQAGQKVLINDASGGVGTFAVQIAKSFGAEVTAVCSTKKLDLACSIGADRMIDYIQEDFTKNEQHYELILDVAAHHYLFDFKRALSSKGIYVCIGGSIVQYIKSMLIEPLIRIFGSKKTGSMFGNPTQKDYAFLIELFEAGKVVPIIDKRYTLSEVAEAFRYLEERHARGKVSITVDYITKSNKTLQIMVKL